MYDIYDMYMIYVYMMREGRPDDISTLWLAVSVFHQLTLEITIPSWK